MHGNALLPHLPLAVLLLADAAATFDAAFAPLRRDFDAQQGQCEGGMRIYA